MATAIEFAWRVRRAGASVIVELIGELDLASAPGLTQALGLIVDQGNRHLVFDLSELSFVDSSGLGALAAACYRARALGGDVLLSNPSSSTRKLLEISGLSGLFPVDA